MSQPQPSRHSRRVSSSSSSAHPSLSQPTVPSSASRVAAAAGAVVVPPAAADRSREEILADIERLVLRLLRDCAEARRRRQLETQTALATDGGEAAAEEEREQPAQDDCSEEEEGGDDEAEAGSALRKRRRRRRAQQQRQHRSAFSIRFSVQSGCDAEEAEEEERAAAATERQWELEAELVSSQSELVDLLHDRIKATASATTTSQQQGSSNPATDSRRRLSFPFPRTSAAHCSQSTEQHRQRAAAAAGSPFSAPPTNAGLSAVSPPVPLQLLCCPRSPSSMATSSSVSTSPVARCTTGRCRLREGANSPSREVSTQAASASASSTDHQLLPLAACAQPRSSSLSRSLSSVSAAVETICSLLRVQRRQLLVVAAAKGLVAGELSYRLQSEPRPVDCRSSVLIPAICDTDRLQIVHCAASLSYCLLVEKEAVYHELQAAGFHLRHRCALITGKGFPCYATREFLIALTRALPGLPVFALVDCDVDGLSIYSCFRHGSRSSSRQGERLAVGRVRLLGLEVEEAQELRRRLSEAQDGRQQLPVLPLTDTDRKKIERMCGGQAAAKDDSLRRQLQSLRDWGFKAELECLEAYGSRYICDYIPFKVQKMMRGEQTD